MTLSVVSVVNEFAPPLLMSIGEGLSVPRVCRASSTMLLPVLLVNSHLEARRKGVGSLCCYFPRRRRRDTGR